MTELVVGYIAKVCHETNRAYCATLGDSSQPVWEDAPEWQRSSAVKGVLFHLDALKSGVEPKPSASHDSWLAAYGLVKDPAKKEHPCFVPYDQLPTEQRLKDYLFSAVVKAYWEASL